jgi:hypothetical protein
MRSVMRFASIASAAISLFARSSHAQAVPAADPGYFLVLEEDGPVSGEYPFGPPPASYTSAGWPGLPGSGSGPLGTSSLFDGDASAQASISLTGSPSIAVVASTIGGSALAEAQLYYSFEVVGPPGSKGTGVPVDVSATLTTQVVGEVGEAVAELSITNFGGLATAQAQDAGLPSPPYAPAYDSENYFGVLDLELGTVYQVYMTVTAGAVPFGDPPAPSGTSSASIDPTITIDPTFLSENPGDSIVFSDGVTQGSSVPDSASTLTLLSGALAGLAALRCRFAK